MALRKCLLWLGSCFQATISRRAAQIFDGQLLVSASPLPAERLKLNLSQFSRISAQSRPLPSPLPSFERKIQNQTHQLGLRKKAGHLVLSCHHQSLLTPAFSPGVQCIDHANTSYSLLILILRRLQALSSCLAPLKGHRKHSAPLQCHFRWGARNSTYLQPFLLYTPIMLSAVELYEVCHFPELHGKRGSDTLLSHILKPFWGSVSQPTVASLLQWLSSSPIRGSQVVGE